MSLYTEWRNLYTANSQALKTLNTDLLEKFTIDDFENWQRRKTEIPDNVKTYMRKQVYPVIAIQHNISVDQVKKILESLT